MSDTDITIDDRWLAETERLAGEATVGPWEAKSYYEDEAVGEPVRIAAGMVAVAYAWVGSRTVGENIVNAAHIARVDPAAVRAWARETRRAWAREAELAGLLAEWVSYHEEFDAYPTSDSHPLYKTRAALRADDPAPGEKGA